MLASASRRKREAGGERLLGFPRGRDPANWQLLAGRGGGGWRFENPRSARQ